MNVNNETDRLRLIKALEEVWIERRDEVEQFGLAIEKDHVAPMYGGWVVPVASGIQGGSAYELVRTLTNLQEITEAKTSLSVSLMLDPFATTNGTH
jgi:hypothetical protein